MLPKACTETTVIRLQSDEPTQSGARCLAAQPDPALRVLDMGHFVKSDTFAWIGKHPNRYSAVQQGAKGMLSPVHFLLT